MSLRDILSSVMSPREGPQIGSDEYQKLLADNMARYHGNRDTAVMNTNLAGGYGSSTAQRFMHDGGAPVDPMATGGIPLPTPRPEAPLPTPTPLAATGPGIGSGIPTPTTPIVGAPVPQDRPVDPGIGSGIPMPTSDQLAIPTPRPGGITIGNPNLPVQAPVPTSKPSQYALKKGSGKKKKRA